MANSETLLRMCDSCGGVDDHPRHVHGTADGESNTSPEIAAVALKNGGPDAVDGILRHVADRTTTMKHMDCCAADGCPEGSCVALKEEYGIPVGEKKGDALRNSIVSAFERESK